MSERDIFDSALEIKDLVQRAAYLDHACADDRRLREHLDSLLRMHGQVGGFLEAPAVAAVATVDDPSVSERPGTVIGPYKLLEQIGEGGFGVVFMAEQTQPVRRKLALKILKPGMDTRRVVARFEAERQALALMDHLNIARVYDGGETATGRPYFVMELVRGLPITEFCDQNRLSIRERLELFVDVCQAVQHAHQKGIIHRDIKPSNVMVTQHDASPVAKVIDFGVAKATGQQLTDKTLFTNFMQMIGTPLYMSPEQAGMSSLDVDTRSDIYSLGVLLYELLTGTTPFGRERLREAGYDEIRRIICEDEPLRPSTRISTLGQAAATVSVQRQSEPKQLSQLIRGELDWIVMKALEKDRNRRYETANGLAMDLQRYLHDEQVLACPPSVGYRLRKFLRRNKIPALAAMIVLLALTGGIVGTTWGLLQAVRERDEKESARQTAQDHFLQAKRAVDDYFTKVSESTLLDKPGLQPLRKELLESALGYYQNLLKKGGEEPGLQAEIGATYLRMFVIYLTLGYGDEACAALQTGLEIVERLVTNDPSNTEVLKRLAGFWNVERFFYTGPQNNPKLSDPLHALRILQKAAQVWEKLADDYPTLVGFQNDLAAFLTYIGDHLWNSGRASDALRAYEKAGAIREKLNSTNSNSREHRSALAESRNGLGWMLLGNGRHVEAEKAYRQALDLLDQLVSESPKVPHYQWQLASCLANLGQMLTRINRHKESEQHIRLALSIREKLLADFPGVPAFEAEVARSHQALGVVLAAAGNADEAEKILRRGIDQFEKLIARFPNQSEYRKELGWSYFDLAKLMESIGRPNDAERAYRAAFLQWEKYVTASPEMVNYRWWLVQCSMRRVNILRAADKHQDAEKIYRHTIQFFANLEAVHSTNLAFKAESFEYFFLSSAHWHLGEKEKARAYYQKAEAAMNANKRDDEEIRRFRAATAKLLGIKDEKK